MNRYVTLPLLLLALTACASNPYYEEPPTAPANISPSPGVDIIAGAETEFVWRASERVEFYDFHLFNQTNGDITQFFRRGLNPTQVCSADRCSVILNVEFPSTVNHAWRVRAVNTAGDSIWTRSIFNVVDQ